MSTKQTVQIEVTRVISVAVGASVTDPALITFETEHYANVGLLLPGEVAVALEAMLGRASEAQAERATRQ